MVVIHTQESNLPLADTMRASLCRSLFLQEVTHNPSLLLCVCVHTLCKNYPLCHFWLNIHCEFYYTFLTTPLCPLKCSLWYLNSNTCDIWLLESIWKHVAVFYANLDREKNTFAQNTLISLWLKRPLLCLEQQMLNILSFFYPWQNRGVVVIQAGAWGCASFHLACDSSLLEHWELLASRDTNPLWMCLLPVSGPGDGWICGLGKGLSTGQHPGPVCPVTKSWGVQSPAMRCHLPQSLLPTSNWSLCR